MLFFSLVGVGSDKVKALVEFIKAELSILKTTKKGIGIRPEQSVRISCHVNVDAIEDRIPVLFEPKPEWPWAVGLEIPEALATVSKGS